MQAIVDQYYIEPPTMGPVWEDWMINNEKSKKYVGRTSLALYAKYMDSVVNFGIRNKRISEIGYILYKRMIRLINEAPNNPDTLYLFRGIRDTRYFRLKLDIGDTFSDPAFSSRTTSPVIARDFAGETCCAIIVKYPANTQPFIYTDDDSFDSNGNAYLESEYLTYPGEVLRVQSVENIKFATKYLKTYVCSVERITFDNIESYIDTSIDKDFKEFYRTLEYSFNTYDVVTIEFIGRTYYIFKDEDEMMANSILVESLSNVINLREDLYSIYSKFCSGLIKNVVYIKNVKYEDIYIGDEYKYIVEGNVYTKEIKTNEDIKTYYKYLLRGGIIYESKVERIESVSTPAPGPFVKPLKKIEDSPIILREYNRLTYDIDIYDALRSIWSFDPVFYKYFREPTEKELRIERLILKVQTQDPNQIASSVGMIIPPTKSARKYFLKNIVDYINADQNQLETVMHYGYYYPADKYVNGIFMHNRMYKNYFIPVYFNEIINITIVNSRPIFVGEPYIAYGTYQEYECFTIDEVRYKENSNLQELINLMGL